MYTTEVYPTVIRSTGLGIAVVWSRSGGILSTFTAHIMDTTIAMILFAVMAFLSAFCCYSLSIGNFPNNLATFAFLDEFCFYVQTPSFG